MTHDAIHSIQYCIESETYHLDRWYVSVLADNANIGNKWTAKFSDKINLTEKTYSSLLLFEIASSSKLEVESANGSK